MKDGAGSLRSVLMRVTEADELRMQLERDIRSLIVKFEQQTELLIVDSIYVNRTTSKTIDGKIQSVLNTVECEVRLM